MTLKQLRKEKKMKQETLALIIGVGRSTVACWESGQRRPTRENVIELAKLFKRSYEEIERIFTDLPTD